MRLSRPTTPAKGVQASKAYLEAQRPPSTNAAIRILNASPTSSTAMPPRCARSPRNCRRLCKICPILWVRASKTREEAVKALKIAIAEVHKSIALLRADDPIALQTGTREGSFVAETLQVADNKLEKAVGL